MNIANIATRNISNVEFKDKSGTLFELNKVVSFKPFPAGSIVFGGHFGDEGKGKLVDILAEQYKQLGYKVLSIRGQGSGNAGHTVKVNGVKYDFHYLTSAGLAADKMILGPGMLIDPIRVLEEAKKLPEDKREIIMIAERASIVSNLERAMDSWCENKRSLSGEMTIGTTRSGVGPGAGIRGFREHVTFADALACKTIEEFKHLFLKNFLFPEEVLEVFSDEYCKDLWDAIHELNVVDSCIEISKCRSDGDWAVLFEVSQAVALDPLFGNSGHFTTSTPCTNIGGVAFAGLTMDDFPDGSIMVLKAYASKVGSGPFNTEFAPDEEKISDFIHDVVGEVGVTSGRKRLLGWFDGVAVRYAIGLTNPKICINCMDVIADLTSVCDDIKICFAYKNIHTGKVTYNWPYHLKDFKPLYITLNIKGKSKKQIISEYTKLLEMVIGKPISGYGTGPSREDFVFCEKVL